VASIQRRRTKSGDAWRVQYRVDGRMTSTTLFTAEDAAWFGDLVDRLGGATARQVLAARDSSDSRSATLAAYLRGYVEHLEGITAGTRKDYLGMIANRIDGTALGELPLDAVSRDAVTAWLNSLDVATKTRRNYHALVSAGLTQAVEEGAIPANPAKGIRIRQVEPVHDMVILSPGELAILLGALPDRHRPLVLTLAGTGLRWGEATALTVGDVDLDARVPLLRVTKAWKRTGSGARELGPPKTRAGARTVSLPFEVAEAIRPLVDGRRSDELLFPGARGRPLRSSNFHDLVWRPTLDRLNADRDVDGNPILPLLAKRPRVHDLRHFQASQQVAAGVPLNVVQRRLGHESIKTTVDRYSHLAPDYLEVSAAAASIGLVQAAPVMEPASLGSGS
jgi:integrase